MKRLLPIGWRSQTSKPIGGGGNEKTPSYWLA